MSGEREGRREKSRGEKERKGDGRGEGGREEGGERGRENQLGELSCYLWSLALSALVPADQEDLGHFWFRPLVESLTRSCSTSS